MLNLVLSRSPMGYVLQPITWKLMLASRFAAPSSNKLITAAKSSHYTQSRFIMDFRTNEGREKAQAWYNYQGAKTRFTRLEYRKVKHGQIKHEFIVVHLSNTTICRFDRRPQDKERGSAFLDEGAPAEDSAHVLSSFETEYGDLTRETEVLLTISLPHGEDLGFILTICEAIQTHGEAVAYNLMRYNCYFFSWMIVAAVARRTYDWETVVLSKAGWDDILQTSFGHVFSAKNIRSPARGVGMRERFDRTVKRLGLYRASPVSIGSFEAHIETFRNALLITYSNLHGNLQQMLQTLLLRSQLGSALRKELNLMEPSGFLSAKLAVTLNQVELPCPRRFNVIPCRGLCSCSKPRKVLTDASRAAAEILSAPKYPGGSGTNNAREEPWRDAWRDAWRAVYDNREYPRYASQFFSKEWAETNMDPAMKQWKNAWDEAGALSAQYTTTITQTIATTMMAQLTDVDPEQLMFGDNAHNQYRKCFSSSEGPPSLQEFIRSRMQDHFEMVDRFGFGSFQELITTAEEAMCDIWVASLDTIALNRYHA
ncbi:unnamed protein product [Rhizoctonia solani]|uniref:Uncharacterized protein n=1 Tax=Rhizoctonia solani TaxID=456999 RepID=A0A8H3I2P1_9AGAM|nr:unnamed protein product [Rhizoctonia solani]